MQAWLRALRGRPLSVCALLALILFLFVAPGFVCGQANVTYIYDALGRLVGVIDSSGNAAAYHYDAVGNLLSIKRYTAAQVSIIAFSPTSGTIGTTVTISGTGFSTTPSQDTVTFNGVSATVSSATANQIVASVPANATTGPISVTTPAGSATSSGPFTVAVGASSGLPPTISGFTPTIGTADTSVTISGTGFQPVLSDNGVKFNDTFAQLSSATSTSITTAVPALAASGRISVATPYGTAVSGSDFFVPPPPYTAANLGLTGRMAIGSSTTVTLSGQIGLLLFDGTAGEVISLAETSNTYPNGALSFSILEPDGGTLASYGGAWGSASLNNETLPATGTYTVYVNPGSSSGAATFTLTQSTIESIALNTPESVSSALAGQTSDLAFTGTAGEVISVAETNNTYPGGALSFTILEPDGTALAGYGDAFGSASLNNETLPAAGTYTIYVNPGSSSGGATFTLTQNISESIGLNTPQSVSSTLAGQAFDLTFSGTAGEVISLAETNNTYPCGAPIFTILNPNGTTLASTQPCGSGSLNNETLPATGTYTIYVNSGSSTGGATFTLTQNISESISLNTPQSVSTTLAGQAFDLTFSGTAGEVISLAETSNTYPCGEPIFTILKPDGTTLASTQPCGSGSLNNETLPATGTYTIYVNSGSSSGSATFTLTQNISESISLNTPQGVSSTLAGQAFDLTFSGTAGEVISLAETSNTHPCGEPAFTILKPDGTTLASTQPCGSGSLNNETLPATGTYTIYVNSGSSTGGATFTLTQNIAESISLNTPESVSSTLAGQAFDLTFSGTAGEVLSLAETNSSYPYCGMIFTILNPDGTTLASAYACGNASLNSETLAQTGTYTVLVNPYASTGGATFTLSQ